MNNCIEICDLFSRPVFNYKSVSNLFLGVGKIIVTSLVTEDQSISSTPAAAPKVRHESFEAGWKHEMRLKKLSVHKLRYERMINLMTTGWTVNMIPSKYTP